MKYFFGTLLCFFYFISNAQNKVTNIKMQRTACFGRCPEYTVELSNDGLIHYFGKKNVENIGDYQGKISIASMSKFLKEVSKYKLNALKELYKPMASDLPRVHFNFIINGKNKSIKNAESGPRYLEAIALKIDSLVKEVTLKTTETPVSEENNGPELNLQVDKDKSVFVVVEQEPEFPGGIKSMNEFIQANIKYPKVARNKNIQGKVICGFVVNEDGKISDIKVQKGIGGGCDEEAVRVISLMPNWKPGKQNGRPVNAKFNLPISFKLD